MSKKSLKAALPTVLLSSFVSCAAVCAADEGSMDTMWSDPAVNSGKGAPAGSAALCSLETLNHSDLIKSGGWPGIGPFKPDNGGFVDAGQNRLQIQANNNKVTQAELQLNNQPKQTALVNLEMSTDFLLESLGAKAARISDFNLQFEREKQKLQGNKGDANLSAGSYIVNLHPVAGGAQPDKCSYVISVRGKDLAPDVVASAAAPAVAPAVVEEQVPIKTIAAAPKAEPAPAEAEPAPARVEPAPAKVEAAPKVEPAADWNQLTMSGDPNDTTPTIQPSKRTSAPVETAVAPAESTPVSAETAAVEPAVKETPTKIASAAVPLSSPPSVTFGIETPKQTRNLAQAAAKVAGTKPAAKTESDDNNGWGSTAAKPTIASAAPARVTPNTKPVVQAPVKEPEAPPEKENLKTKFGDLIQNWQNVKKTAVRQKDITELPEVLSGRALTKQSDAVKWLLTNKKYYDMTPKGVVVDKVVDLGKGLKYAVYAEVKEYSKYIDEATGQTLKINDDTYNVNYTVEKTGDRWFISDSALVPTKGAPPKR